MKAMLCTALGGPVALSDVAPPGLPALGVRIKVAAAGVNFADTLLIAGKYQHKLEPPFSPGMELAGTVVEVADGVTTCKPGDRVMAVVDGGAWAEEAVAAETDVVVLPDAVDFATAAGFPIAWGTSHHALKYKARLAAGETLVVHGAAGGVGLTAVEVGRQLGATVIATAGGAEKVRVALDHGAHHGIDYKSEDIRARIKELTGGRGADVVYDPVGGEVFEASLRSIAPDGRILAIGFASGQVPQIPANILLVKNGTVIGYWWGAYRKLNPAAVRDSLHELLGWLADGRIRQHISATLPLDQADKAFSMLKDRAATGKVIIKVQ